MLWVCWSTCQVNEWPWKAIKYAAAGRSFLQQIKTKLELLFPHASAAWLRRKDKKGNCCPPQAQEPCVCLAVEVMFPRKASLPPQGFLCLDFCPVTEEWMCCCIRAQEEGSSTPSTDPLTHLPPYHVISLPCRAGNCTKLTQTSPAPALGTSSAPDPELTPSSSSTLGSCHHPSQHQQLLQLRLGFRVKA